MLTCLKSNIDRLTPPAPLTVCHITTLQQQQQQQHCLSAQGRCRAGRHCCRGALHPCQCLLAVREGVGGASNALAERARRCCGPGRQWHAAPLSGPKTGRGRALGGHTYTHKFAEALTTCARLTSLSFIPLSAVYQSGVARAQSGTHIGRLPTRLGLIAGLVRPLATSAPPGLHAVSFISFRPGPKCAV